MILRSVIKPKLIFFGIQFLLLFFLPYSSALECYKNSAIGLDIEHKICNPSLQPYCVKANVYDGTISRDCASAKQCPQGNTCAPITYTEDSTTDFVCCCDSDFCNSATRNSYLLVLFFTSLLLIQITFFPILL